MTTNQTIDGVLVSRELLRRVSDPYRPRGQENARQELRALLDAPVNPLSEIEVLRAAVKELEAMRDARVYAKLAQGEPVAWRNIATGHVTTSAVVVMDWDDEKEQVQSLYAEQPAPVAVVPDGYCIMPRQLTAENGAKALLLGEFKLLVTKECPECCELEEPVEGCSICDGEGEYGQKHTIPWDQIKFIYSKAVSGLAVNSEPAKSR